MVLSPEREYQVISKTTFHIYDAKMLELVNNVEKGWDKSLSFSHNYYPDSSGNNAKFDIPYDKLESQKAMRDFEKLRKIGRKLEKDFKAFIIYIRENYLEIDVDTESNNAEIPQ